MKTTDLHIGDFVRFKVGLHGKLSIPMKVVGIFSSFRGISPKIPFTWTLRATREIFGRKRCRTLYRTRLSMRYSKPTRIYWIGNKNNKKE